MEFLTLPWIGFKHFRLTLDESGARALLPVGDLREGGQDCPRSVFALQGGVDVSIHISFSLSACVVTVRLWGMIPLKRHQAGHYDADASQEAYVLHSLFSVREGCLGGIVGEPPLESGDESRAVRNFSKRRTSECR